MTQDGERELVLGNKQLISLFFVGVALCGIFFALGYRIGHDTSKPTVVSADSPSATTPGTASPVTEEAEPPRETQAQSPTPTLADAQPPATSAPAPAAESAQTPAPAEAPATAPAATTKTRAAQDVHEATSTAVPQPGATYLQVTALHRDDADKLVKTLKEQNFPAIVADSSRPDYFRVMVGPYHQTADVADAKARLKALGFANAFVQK